MTQTHPPMDWYPDPADPTRERYWDGQSWTHNTRARRAPQPDAAAPAVDPWRAREAQQPIQPGQASNPYPGQPSNAHRGQPAGPWGPMSGQALPVSPVPVTADGVRLASWWQRVGARILDSILVQLVVVAIGWKWASSFAAGYWGYLAETVRAAQAGQQPAGFEETYGRLVEADFMNDLNTFMMITLLLTVVYHLVMLRWRGATFGKSALGLRVVPTDQGRAQGGLSWRRAILRAVVDGALQLINLVWLINVLIPLGQSKKQTLHDMAAGTQVVRRR